MNTTLSLIKIQPKSTAICEVCSMDIRHSAKGFSYKRNLPVACCSPKCNFVKTEMTKKSFKCNLRQELVIKYSHYTPNCCSQRCILPCATLFLLKEPSVNFYPSELKLVEPPLPPTGYNKCPYFFARKGPLLCTVNVWQYVYSV